MTAADTRPRLSTSDIALLRSVLVWARANGWRRFFIDENVPGYARNFESWNWTGPILGAAEVFIERTESWTGVAWRFVIGGDAGGDEGIELGRQDRIEVREAVDVLAALGVIPARFSSAFRAGRDAALDRDEWRVCAIEGVYTAVFEAEIYSEEHLAIVLRDAHKRWIGENLQVQHRRVGASEWRRVETDATD